MSKPKPDDSFPADDAFTWSSSTQAHRPSGTHFVRGAAGPAAKGVLERAGGRLTRRMTMYLSPELARRVVLHCAETGREISDVAAEALERYLAR